VVIYQTPYKWATFTLQAALPKPSRSAALVPQRP
jgi:hypothetical protein